jgi:hypothetical protein
VAGIYSLEEAGLMDGFFHWLEELGVIGKLQGEHYVFVTGSFE